MSTNVLIKFLADTKQAVGEVKKLTKEQERLAKSAEGASGGFARMLGSFASGLGTFGLAIGGVEKGVRLMNSALDMAKNAPGLSARQRDALKEIDQRLTKTGESIKSTFAKIIAEMAAALEWFLTGLERADGATKATIKAHRRGPGAMKGPSGIYVLPEAVALKDFGDVTSQLDRGDYNSSKSAAEEELERRRREDYEFYQEQEKREKAIRDDRMEKQRKADREYLDRVRAYDKAWMDYYAWVRNEELREAQEDLQRQIEMAGVKAGNVNFSGLYGTSERTRSLKQQSADLDIEDRAALLEDTSSRAGMTTAALQDAYAAGASAAMEGEAGIAKAAIKGAQMRLKVIALESGVQAIYWAAMYNWDKAARFAAAAVAAGAASTALGGVASMIGGGGGGRGGGGYGQAGGGFVRGSGESGPGDSPQTIVVNVGEGFVGDPQSLAEEIDRKLRAGKRSGRIRDGSGAVTFRG